jgi:hypothetical protein
MLNDGIRKSASVVLNATYVDSDYFFEVTLIWRGFAKTTLRIDKEDPQNKIEIITEWHGKNLRPESSDYILVIKHLQIKE